MDPESGIFQCTEELQKVFQETSISTVFDMEELVDAHMTREREFPVLGPDCEKCDRINHPGLTCDEHDPKHQYDCNRCKYSWCCGPLCACFPAIGPEPPPKRKKLIKDTQRLWRESRRQS